MSLYREKIFDHYRNPRHRGILKKPHCSCHGNNPLCGDEFDVYAKIKEGRIYEMSFTGEGCAISLSSLSLLSDKVLDMKIADVHKMDEHDIMEMLGIPLSVARVKCAMLGLRTLQQCLKNSKKKLNI